METARDRLFGHSIFGVSEGYRCAYGSSSSLAVVDVQQCRQRRDGSVDEASTGFQAAAPTREPLSATSLSLLAQPTTPLAKQLIIAASEISRSPSQVHLTSDSRGFRSRYVEPAREGVGVIGSREIVTETSEQVKHRMTYGQRRRSKWDVA